MWGYKYNTMKDQRLIRNWAQVANSDAVFAIGTLGKEGDIWKGDEKSAEPRKLLKVAVQGGTGYAVEMAIQAGKPVYVFDQVRNQWYKNINGEWSKSEVPTLTKNFAGIGTREINEAGKQAIRDVYANMLNAPTQLGSNLPGPENKMNIYASTGENVELSNFAERPFNIKVDNLMQGEIVTSDPREKYISVEQAFQVMKYQYLNWHTDAPRNSEEQQEAIDNVIAEIDKETNPSIIKKLGRKVQLSKEQVAAWDKVSLQYMKTFITESFKQNPDALAKLLATGNAELTHTQDKSKWGTEFPRLLMEVRNELRPTQPSETETEDKDFYSQEIKPVTNFYESLTDSEKEKLGNLADVIDSYEELYADTMSVQEYIDNVLKCKL
jgi:predicted NAD-dependent protein-ADP-ribosyltransferase YbiA (DUF1768 family)